MPPRNEGAESAGGGQACGWSFCFGDRCLQRDPSPWRVRVQQPVWPAHPRATARQGDHGSWESPLPGRRWWTAPPQLDGPPAHTGQAATPPFATRAEVFVAGLTHGASAWPQLQVHPRVLHCSWGGARHDRPLRRSPGCARPRAAPWSGQPLSVQPPGGRGPAGTRLGEACEGASRRLAAVRRGSVLGKGPLPQPGVRGR